MAYPNTPTATAASRSARSWSISTRASGLMVAVFLGCRSFCTAETEAHTFDVTSITGVNCSHELITQGCNVASRASAIEHNVLLEFERGNDVYYTSWLIACQSTRKRTISFESFHQRIRMIVRCIGNVMVTRKGSMVSMKIDFWLFTVRILLVPEENVKINYSCK